MSVAEPLELSRCSDCQSLFLPRPGVCPRCGGHAVAVERVAPVGRVLVAVQLEYPPAGFPTPHRLALVELGESVRLLAVLPGAIPAVGNEVQLRREAGQLVAEPPPGPA